MWEFSLRNVNTHPHCWRFFRPSTYWILFIYAYKKRKPRGLRHFLLYEWSNFFLVVCVSYKHGIHTWCTRDQCHFYVYKIGWIVLSRVFLFNFTFFWGGLLKYVFDWYFITNGCCDFSKGRIICNAKLFCNPKHKIIFYVKIRFQWAKIIDFNCHLN